MSLDPSLAILAPVLNPVSPQARALSELFGVTMGVCGAVFLLVVGLIAWCLARYRAQAGQPDPAPNAGSDRLELGWTAATILTLVCLFVLSARAMQIADPEPSRSADLTVIGHQWWWEIRYPGGAVSANELHLPTGVDVLVAIGSADVIHSFWVPQLGRKIEAIPGHPNQIWIRADAPGEYLGTCSEFCGAQHAWMRILVIAQPLAEYQAWLTAETARLPPTETGPARRGETFFQQHACVTCHAVGGSPTSAPAGPDLTHFASRQTIAAGVLPNTPATLRRWLANPQAVKPGSHMPNFHLSPSQVEDLGAYLETLR